MLFLCNTNTDPPCAAPALGTAWPGLFWPVLAPQPRRTPGDSPSPATLLTCVTVCTGVKVQGSGDTGQRTPAKLYLIHVHSVYKETQR